MCFALSQNRTKKTVDLVLNEFIPGCKEIDGGYAFNSTTDLTFDNEASVLRYLEDAKTEKGTIHWSKKEDNFDSIMIGAYFTSDGQLILGLTVSANGYREQKYLKELKGILGSDIGVISYSQFLEFDNGEDFKNKYSLQHK